MKDFIQIKDDNEEIFSTLKKSYTFRSKNYLELYNCIQEDNYNKIVDIFKDKKEKKKINNEDYYILLKEIISKLKKKLRDFRYPISLQTPDKRDTVKKKFKEEKEEEISFPTHSGSNYSTSEYISFYLIRQ